ncbi:unnamed protein product [Ostreobium quekettii]|uniref:Uncharacterized protein n=1 Tax=Ostreobium quekettii TaxID=121088 RepID=A0A8S1IVJ0_9CHLO|nr:unnamed protein product [Ostreobium quekettii]|eukprot:evm.model.scf_19.10 EVM.evm.TU.scf_19.10   scf_19:198242-199045(-)
MALARLGASIPALLLAMVPWLVAGDEAECAQATPRGLRQQVVVIGDGVYNPLVGPFPDGCSPGDPFITQGFCSGGDAFFSGVLKYGDDEVAAMERNARAYLLEDHGLDAAELEATGQAVFFNYTLDPRLGLVVSAMGGECVPRRGYAVRDGGFGLAITADRGVMLRGGIDRPRNGYTAERGSALLFGAYSIKVTGSAARRVVVRYKATAPVAQDRGLGGVPISYALSSEEWGEGQALGVNADETTLNGTMRHADRVVMTFPPYAEAS